MPRTKKQNDVTASAQSIEYIEQLIVLAKRHKVDLLEVNGIKIVHDPNRTEDQPITTENLSEDTIIVKTEGKVETDEDVLFWSSNS